MQHASFLDHEYQRCTRRLETAPQTPALYVQRGMVSFKRGDMPAAIADFDYAEQLSPTLTPYLWQRGLAYYYAARFADGVRQFTVDLTVNAHDVEETVWRYLCLAQLRGAAAARAVLTPVRHDPRPVMASVYHVFAGTRDAESVLTQYQEGSRPERFYSQLYVGLYFEAVQDASRACQHIVQAAAMQMVDDYMGWVALVHQRLRGWEAC